MFVFQIIEYNTVILILKILVSYREEVMFSPWFACLYVCLQEIIQVTASILTKSAGPEILLRRHVDTKFSPPGSQFPFGSTAFKGISFIITCTHVQCIRITSWLCN